MAAYKIKDTTLFNDANLVSYYKLEDVSDSKGSATLTNNNTVTFSAGKFDNAANGGTGNTNKDLWTTNQMSANATSTCTIMLWLNLIDAVSGAEKSAFCLAAGADATHAFGRIIMVKEAGAGMKIVGSFYGGTQVQVTSTTAPVQSAWYHVAITDDGNADIKLFVNGTAEGGTGTRVNDTGAWTLGTSILSRNNSDEFFPGLVDDVAIFNRVLTPTEISNYYSGALNIGSGFLPFL